ncbi:hypothetical protein UY3_01491 [Chelonia mydas]|uniref:Uncharacterized protein n=1 Tax=Chelonia mydas TaxID=8469 RepID=M7BTU4_CHEMY|nr:hypothetical protein UY3_01491 [Chelonia mydas]
MFPGLSADGDAKELLGLPADRDTDELLGLLLASYPGEMEDNYTVEINSASCLSATHKQFAIDGAAKNIVVCIVL